MSSARAYIGTMNRRRFLSITAGLAMAPGGVLAAPMVAAGTRVRLVDAHSGVVFDGVYRTAAGPVPKSLDELDLFLRDQHTGGVTSIDVGVIDFVVAVMAQIGQPSAIVLSAYRSLQTNARLARTMFGVADNSQHLYGRALDVAFSPKLLPDAVIAARTMKRGGVGWYPHSGFIHLDVGPVRNWDLGEIRPQGTALSRPAAHADPAQGQRRHAGRRAGRDHRRRRQADGRRPRPHRHGAAPPHRRAFYAAEKVEKTPRPFAGEGGAHRVSDGLRTLTRLAPSGAIHPLPQAGEG